MFLKSVRFILDWQSVREHQQLYMKCITILNQDRLMSFIQQFLADRTHGTSRLCYQIVRCLSLMRVLWLNGMYVVEVSDSIVR